MPAGSFVTATILRPVSSRNYNNNSSEINMATIITYVKASQEDVPVFVENRISFATELAGILDEALVLTLRKQMMQYFAKAIADDSCISFMAICGGVVAGIGSVHIREMPGNFKNPSGKWGYIMNMYTVPHFRRKGVCSGIVNALVEEASRYGVTGFELHATPEGEMVYKQEGFVQHNEPTYRKFVKG
jgi:predicted acetyltransferase